MGSHSHCDSKRIFSVLGKSDEHVFLSALILLGLIFFGFFVLANTGLLQLALTSDRSMISWVILTLYTLATLHWLVRARALDRENALCRSVADSPPASSNLDGSYVGLALTTPTDSVADRQHLLDTIGDELTNTHAAGHFVADLLLKLGLTGTVIGFILMLLPIGEIDQFDPSLMQQLLAAMSGGMAVALYTTLAGLVTSTLLKLQYYLLDSALANLVNRMSLLGTTQPIDG
ncbi:MAG: biopolymer transporter ExbB [Proteobacteria bacterium]|nr:biopolymer transporter ExbB [Pseudomonadota bacterium]